MKKSIKFFKDSSDYKRIITNDSVINIIGNKVSDKTTFSNKYINDEYCC